MRYYPGMAVGHTHTRDRYKKVIRVYVQHDDNTDAAEDQHVQPASADAITGSISDTNSDGASEMDSIDGRWDWFGSDDDQEDSGSDEERAGNDEILALALHEMYH